MISGIELSPQCGGKLVYNNADHSGNPRIITPTDSVSFFLIDGIDNGGLGLRVTEDGANGTLTVLRGGLYEVESGISLQGEQVNTFVHLSHFLDNGEVTTGQLERKVGVGGDIGAITLTDTLSLLAGQVLDLRVKSSQANFDIEFQHITFKARC